MDHTVFTLLTRHTCLYLVSVHLAAPPLTSSISHLITAYDSFIDPVRMKGWVGLVSWPRANGLPMAYTHQLPISCRSWDQCSTTELHHYQQPSLSHAAAAAFLHQHQGRQFTRQAWYSLSAVLRCRSCSGRLTWTRFPITEMTEPVLGPERVFPYTGVGFVDIGFR